LGYPLGSKKNLALLMESVFQAPELAVDLHQTKKTVYRFAKTPKVKFSKLA